MLDGIDFDNVAGSTKFYDIEVETNSRPLNKFWKHKSYSDDHILFILMNLGLLTFQNTQDTYHNPFDIKNK